jgi:hypothetical protein
MIADVLNFARSKFNFFRITVTAFNERALKRAIANFLESNTAFLIVDDAHSCDAKFRLWLKQLRRGGVCGIC